MSYTPLLIIRKKDLEKSIPILEEEQYSNDDDTSKVAIFLININKSQVHKFDELELVICRPEFSSFNTDVRNRLDELKIEYSTEP